MCLPSFRGIWFFFQDSRRHMRQQTILLYSAITFFLWTQVPTPCIWPCHSTVYIAPFPNSDGTRRRSHSSKKASNSCASWLLLTEDHTPWFWPCHSTIYVLLFPN